MAASESVASCSARDSASSSKITVIQLGHNDSNYDYKEKQVGPGCETHEQMQLCCHAMTLTGDSCSYCCAISLGCCKDTVPHDSSAA